MRVGGRGKRETYCVSCQRPLGLGYRDRLGRCCKRGEEGERQPSIRQLIEERRLSEGGPR